MLEKYRELLRGLMNDLADSAATGACTSWEEYKHLTGQIAGLARAERLLLDLIEARDKD